jgi:hypothetical protein
LCAGTLSAELGAPHPASTAAHQTPSGGCPPAPCSSGAGLSGPAAAGRSRWCCRSRPRRWRRSPRCPRRSRRRRRLSVWGRGFRALRVSCKSCPGVPMAWQSGMRTVQAATDVRPTRGEHAPAGWALRGRTGKVPWARGEMHVRTSGSAAERQLVAVCTHGVDAAPVIVGALGQALVPGCHQLLVGQQVGVHLRAQGTQPLAGCCCCCWWWVAPVAAAAAAAAAVAAAAVGGWHRFGCAQKGVGVGF